MLRPGGPLLPAIFLRNTAQPGAGITMLHHALSMYFLMPGKGEGRQTMAGRLDEDSQLPNRWFCIFFTNSACVALPVSAGGSLCLSFKPCNLRSQGVPVE